MFLKELEVAFIKMAATEIVSGVSGESEEKLRDVFDKAVVSILISNTRKLCSVCKWMLVVLVFARIHLTRQTLLNVGRCYLYFSWVMSHTTISGFHHNKCGSYIYQTPNAFHIYIS